MSASLRARQSVTVINEGEVCMKLVVIPCGKSKIWDKNPGADPQKARDAYTSAYFNVNRQYADSRHCDWMILSPKYGFIRPDFVIPDNYDVTFGKASSGPMTVQELKRQVEKRELTNYDQITVLGGRGYVETVREAFSNTKAKIEAPFVGHRRGEQMGMIKKMLREEELAQRGRFVTVTPKNAVALHRVKTDVPPSSTVNTETFRKVLQRVFAEAKGSFVDVTSGDLHRLVGGYPGKHHNLPTCCNVMTSAMQSGDIVLAKPPKGRGATLTIRYVLPRSSSPLARTDRVTLTSVLRSTFGRLRRLMRQAASGHRRPAP